MKRELSNLKENGTEFSSFRAFLDRVSEDGPSVPLKEGANVFGRTKDLGISDLRVSRRHAEIILSSTSRSLLYHQIAPSAGCVDIVRDGVIMEEFTDGRWIELQNGDVISIKGGGGFTVRIEDFGCSPFEPTLEEATQNTQMDSLEDSPTPKSKRFKASSQQNQQSSNQTTVMMERVEPPKRKLFLDADRRAKGSGILIMPNELTFVKTIGSGSCGEVNEMIWRGSRVAVKRIFRALLKESARKEFEMESDLLRRLRHPQIVLLMGTCQKDNEALIVTEYIERGSLFDVLRDSSIALDWRIMLKMATDAAKGMNYLHTYNPTIIHRDLKSHNLLVDKDFNVKVSDFGLARYQSDEDNSKTFCGTLPWTAPEVFNNTGYTEKVDVYSYGIVLWEIYTRQEVYSGMNKPNIIVGVTKEDLRPPIGADCPVPYAQLMRDCWQKEPDSRPSFGEILHRLDQMKNLLFPSSSSSQFKSDNPLSSSDTMLVNGMSSANLTQQFQRVAMMESSRTFSGMDIDPASIKESNPDVLDASLVFGDELVEEANYHLYKGTYRQQLATIKIFKDRNSSDSQQQKEEMEKELLIFKTIKDNRIVRFFGMSTEPRLAIVTERFSRGNLHELLSSADPLSWDRAVSLCLECALAVQVLHQNSVIHCNLKPFHFEVDENWTVKIGGFGHSIWTDSALKMDELKGSLSYTAPEVYRTEPMTKKSDIYSLMITYWEILTKFASGQWIKPYAELKKLKLEVQIMIQVAKKGARPPFHPRFPSSFTSLLSKGWSDRPDERPDISAVVNHLEIVKKSG